MACLTCLFQLLDERFYRFLGPFFLPVLLIWRFLIREQPLNDRRLAQWRERETHPKCTSRHETVGRRGHTDVDDNDVTQRLWRRRLVFDIVFVLERRGLILYFFSELNCQQVHRKTTAPVTERRRQEVDHPGHSSINHANNRNCWVKLAAGLIIAKFKV